MQQIGLGNPVKFVMAGLVPAIHVFLSCRGQDVDARHKAGHDEKVNRFQAVRKGLIMLVAFSVML